MPDRSAGGRDYREISYWMDSLGTPLESRPPLTGDLTADVCVIGAGYSGLWTAYYLLTAAPGTRVVVLESEIAGYGASGRNGGWCSALFAASDARIAREHGREAMHAVRRAMAETVDEVGRVATEDGIDCHFRKGGTLGAARSRAQVLTLAAELDEARSLGIGPHDLRWCERDEAAELLAATRLRGALYTPHCAAVHPARLVRGLAERVVARGGALYERSPALEIAPGPKVRTEGGTVSAETVVLATEGYRATVAGHEREVVPIYSLMIATEPLGGERLAALGTALSAGTTFTDGRHLLIYGQMTDDGRIAFGGRGAPYHYGSEISEAFDRDERVHGLLEKTLVELFPALDGVAVTHRWGGPIGVHRDWWPAVRMDRRLGLAVTGGYVGDGVGTSNLAGRILCDLILGKESDLTALPFVGHRSPSWEPEPLRFLGVNAALLLMQAADAMEARTGRPSLLATGLGRLTGG